MGSQMSRCGDLQCSLSEQSKVPVEGISRRAHRVSNSSRKSRTTSWPTATRLCTALLYCVCMLCSLAARSSREPLCSSIVLLHSAFFGLSWGHKHVKEQPSLILGSENLLAIDYTGFYMLFYRLSLSVYQIIIIKNVYRIFQFEVTRALFSYVLLLRFLNHLQILSDLNRTQLNLSFYLNLALIWSILITQIC